MLSATAHIGHMVTILVMAVALGMDALSLGVGIGMKGIRLRDILRLSMVIGFFHILMPLLGMLTGHYMSGFFGQVTAYVAGGLLILLGAHMIYNSFRGGGTQVLDHRSPLGVLLFALSVSIDSFSVGVSLGMFESDVVLTVMAFGICGGAMSMLGLLLGRRVSRNLGDYGEALGGAILLAFGFLFMF